MGAVIGRCLFVDDGLSSGVAGYIDDAVEFQVVVLALAVDLRPSARVHR